MNVLSICTSRKGEAGRLARPSAVRSLLSAAHLGIERAGAGFDEVDFATIHLPPFEGVSLAGYGDADTKALLARLEGTSNILLGVPAYWGGPSGVAKNFLDLSGGAAYAGDTAKPTLLNNTSVTLLVVGAATGDAARAVEQLRYTLEAMRAQVSAEVLAIDRPHDHDREQLIRQALALGILVGRRAMP